MPTGTARYGFSVASILFGSSLLTGPNRVTAIAFELSNDFVSRRVNP